MSGAAQSRQMRASMALVCILAVCCTVMYISSDGADSIFISRHLVLLPFKHQTKEQFGGSGASVESADIFKVSNLYSETPDGKMRLIDYFNNVEREISTEVNNRKNDIASIRAQMARDMAFNEAARAKLKKKMLSKMAANAKQIRDDLQSAMARTHERFAKQASLENKRNHANMARAKQTLKLARLNKRQAAHNLRMAVLAQQRAQSAFASSANAHISQLNKKVAANAAQIKENAKAARKSLEGAVASWNRKIATFKSNSKKGNSKVAAQFAAMNKRTRQMADNKLKSLVASTAARFRHVRAKMAEQRHAIDMAVKHATTRLNAALNAKKAMSDRRYAKTVKDIASAKREANNRVGKASREFRVGIMHMMSTVKNQETKFNKRLHDLSGTVQANRAAQAKVNTHVAAELKRMVALGNKRYNSRLKHDKQLKAMIKKNKAETDHSLNSMASTFVNKLNGIRKQMAYDRKSHEKALSVSTSKLWGALQKQEAFMRSSNAAAANANRRLRLDMMDNLRQAKVKFMKKLRGLGKKVDSVARNNDYKLKSLAGVVSANEARSASGRRLLKAMATAQKQEMKRSMRVAMDNGEKQALKLESKMKKMNSKMKATVNAKLSMEIANLAKRAKKSIAAVVYESKQALAEMHKEMVYAVKSAATTAKRDLALAVRAAGNQLTALQKQQTALQKRSSGALKALKTKFRHDQRGVQRMLRDAVSGQARALLSLKSETAKKLKKTNRRIDATAQQLRRQTSMTNNLVKMGVSSLLAKIKEERRQAADAASQYASRDIAASKKAMMYLQKGLAKAQASSSRKLKVFRALANERGKACLALAGATATLNARIASQAALFDTRFRNTIKPKSMSAARQKAAKDTAAARKAFRTSLAVVTAQVKDVETRLAGTIAVTSGEVAAPEALAARVNKRVRDEIQRTVVLANQRNSSDKRARGKLRSILNLYKKASFNEVRSVFKGAHAKLIKLRQQIARARVEFARDLTASAKRLYLRLSRHQKARAVADRKGKAGTMSTIAARHALDRVKKEFVTKLTMMAGVVLASASRYQRGLKRLTGVVIGKRASKLDRRLLQMLRKSMAADLNKALTRAINIGQAYGKADLQRMALHKKKQTGNKRYLQVELSEHIEHLSDLAFKKIQARRKKIADNYLSLKAYCNAAQDDIISFVTKGKGRALSSVGDLLHTVASVSSVRPKKRPGLSFGNSGKAVIPALFGGKPMRGTGTLGKVNGLVNEFTGLAVQVRRRWPMGLGKYLLSRLAESMMQKGVLEVNKVTGKRGSFVFLNAAAVGLSNTVRDFQVLATSMKTYEKSLTHLTMKLKKPTKKKPKKPIKVPPPQWNGK